jgi:hypothetical protein
MTHLRSGFSKGFRQGIAVTLTGVLTVALALPIILTMAPTSADAALLCTQTITGPHSGVVNVAGNQEMCLIGAIQDGAVNVAPGGGLSVVNSTITGAITLKGGFTSFSFCDSTTVRGAIVATGGLEPVVIGGSGAGVLLCPANTIDGAVTLNSNLAGVTLAYGNISGAVTASANLGGTTLSGNKIGGRLTCSSNAPAPTDAGVTNAVAGGRSGQTCSVLTF